MNNLKTENKMNWQANSHIMNKSTLWNRGFTVILVTNILASFSFYLVVTILAKYITDMGIGISTAGIIVGLFSITALILRPACGVMSDRLNKVRLLRFATLLTAIGLMGYAAADHTYIIVITRIIHGIGFAVCSTTLVTLASEYIPSDRMGEGIGYLGLGQVIASAVAPGMGIMLADAVGMRMTFVISGVMALITFVFMFTLPSSGIKEGVQKHKRIHPKDIIAVDVLGYTIVAGIFSFMNGIIASYLVLYAQTKGIANVSLYFTVCAAVLFFIRPFSGKLMDKKGLNIVVIPGIILAGISLFLIGRFASLSLILLTGIIRSVGQGSAQPSLQAACIKKAGKARSGAAISTFLLGGDVGQGIGPMVGGYFVQSSGYKSLFDFCGSLFIGAFILYLIIRLREKNKGKGEVNCDECQ